MSINWSDLRPWNGSQQVAFEELCCQLARAAPTPPGSRFVRKGAPDAGVECFWTLRGGDEWGWQSKFFLSPPGRSQWQQLDHSIRTALEKHSRLTAYTICLPIDRADPRIVGQTSFMEEWDRHIETWQDQATAKGMSVEFSYWGQSEIAERLSREEHRGRTFFWFHHDFLSDAWFQDRLEEATANAGPRYTPEVNVELPISGLFDGLGRTEAFHRRIQNQRGEVKRAYAKAASRQTHDAAPEDFRNLHDAVGRLLALLADIEGAEISPIEWSLIGTASSAAIEVTRRCRINLEQLAEVQATAQKPADDQSSQASEKERFSWERHHLWELQRGLRNLYDLSQSSDARLANLPALLIAGEAGTGKTHLLCDVASRRAAARLPTLLLYGAHFRNEEPWDQINRLLGLSGRTANELLGALEAAAEARGARALLMIDALNEGEGRQIWNKHLAGILTALSRSPWLGIVLSVRTSYEGTVVPPHLLPQRLVRALHYGFAEHEYQATKTFFAHFGLASPAIPLLVPEFSKPLFLKLFCQALRNKGLTQIPPGLQGITAIFDFFLQSVNQRLAEPERLDYDPRSFIVKQAVERLAQLMAKAGRNWLPRESSRNAVDALLPRTGYENSLFRHLVSEAVLAEDRYRVTDDTWIDGVHFSYERLADHLIIGDLLASHLDGTTPAASFLDDRPLGQLVRDVSACYMNRGLVEALCIQVPERIGQELPDLVPHVAASPPIREAFVESLVWRHPAAIIDGTLAYVNTHVMRYSDTRDAFLNALLTLAVSPDHPFNADFLHTHLARFDLPSRDAWWSTFLHRQHGEGGPVDRLIEWAWSPDDKSHISDEAIRLCGIALTWFLSTAHRSLRDQATKALVTIFTLRIHVLRRAIPSFLGVDDPYVLERLFAAAYGCALRTVDSPATRDLAQDVYGWIFREGHPPPHILLRDYARGVIEVAVRLGTAEGIDLQLVRPPYHSEWPDTIPSEDEVRGYGDYSKDMPDEEWSRVHIYSSVTSYGDFSRYVIDPVLRRWSTLRIGQGRTPSRKEVYEEFLRRLTPRQRRAWKRYRQGSDKLALAKLLSTLPAAEKTLPRQSRRAKRETHASIETLEKAFLRTLGLNKRRVFSSILRPYLASPHRYDEERFDPHVAKRWILRRVFDLGWTTQRFGAFDRSVTSRDRGREARKPERIGKKYQWIAFHELLARLADNFELLSDEPVTIPRHYDGPWQSGLIRDIDPSCVLRRTGRTDAADSTNAWWVPASYTAWDAERDDVAWLRTSHDLPPAQPFLAVKNVTDGSEWIVLEAFYRWEQPTPPDEERYELSRRDIWYMFRSYVVKSSDADELFDWLKVQSFMGRWMPESHETHDVFLGELFWAPAFKYRDNPYYGRQRWTRGDRSRPLPRPVLISTDGYAWERGYDCSIDETLHIPLLCQWLADRMALRCRTLDGAFNDAQGNLLSFDPSVRRAGPSALLIERETLMRFLEESGHQLVWTLLGEKNLIGGSMMSPDAWKGRLDLGGHPKPAIRGQLKTGHRR